MLDIPSINFLDPINTKIIELQDLRTKAISYSTPTVAFVQLHGLFKIVESLASARIEGNHTTIADYVQDKIEGKNDSQQHKEISNIEACVKLIDHEFDVNQEFKVSEFFIKQLHGVLTKDLSIEGSKEPGMYRNHDVSITQSKHKPPEFIKVPEMMKSLFDFINREDPLQADLLKVAIAHHYFVWVHPFDNGNGRMARLLTYIMLKQYGFFKVLFMNPSAIFCEDRNLYIEYLEKADTGTDENIKKWCDYVLSSLLREHQKIRKLLDKNFLDTKIILPAIQYSFNNKLISEEENAVLRCSVSKNDYIIMLKDLKEIFKDKSDAQITYLTRKMLENHLLRKESDRKYAINLNAYNLIRGMFESLINENLVNL